MSGGERNHGVPGGLERRRGRARPRCDADQRGDRHRPHEQSGQACRGRRKAERGQPGRQHVLRNAQPAADDGREDIENRLLGRVAARIQQDRSSAAGRLGAVHGRHASGRGRSGKRHGRDGEVDGAGQCGKQRCEFIDHPLAHCGGGAVRVRQHDGKANALAGHHHGGHAVGGLQCIVHAVDAQAVRASPGVGPGRHVLHDQQGIEQFRCAIADAGRLHHFHQRDLRPGLQCRDLALHLLRERKNRAAGIKAQPYRQVVDEQADHLLHPRHLRRPAGHGGAEDGVAAAAPRRRPQAPGQMRQRGDGEAAPPRQIAQRLAVLRRELPPDRYIGGSAAARRKKSRLG